MARSTPGMADRPIQAVAQRIEVLLDPLYRGLAVLGACAGAAIIGLIGASVATRYVANAPFRFTEELVGLLMTASFFLTLPLVTLRADHVRIRLVADLLSDRAAARLSVVAGIFGLAFCLWFLALCLPWFDFAFSRGIKSEAARLLLWPWMALLPLSLGLTALAFAVRALAGPPARDA